MIIWLEMNLVGRARFAGAAGRLAYPAVLMIAVCAPFETKGPFLRLGNLNVTNVELLVGAALVLAAGDLFLSRTRLRWRTAVTLPVVLLLAFMTLSAFQAYDRGEAFRHVGRFGAGSLVFLAVLNAVRTRRQAVGVALAATASGTLVGLLAILERANVPVVTGFLESLNPDRFVVGGSIRASSTLLYPTVTSMYLELCFGLGLAVLLLSLDRRRAVASALAFFSLLIMFQGIVSTMTRSGVVLAFGMLALVTCCVVYRRGLGRSTYALGALAAAGVCLFIATGGREPALWLRSSGAEQADWYRAGVKAPKSVELETGRLYELEIEVRNLGSQTWDSGGGFPFRLSYHWLTECSDRRSAVILDGLRTALPEKVAPQQTVRVRAKVQSPPQPGRYQLAFDVVHEKRFWFGAQGSPLTVVPATVRGSALAKLGAGKQALPKSEVSFDRLTLWRIGGQMLLEHPVLGIGPDNFRVTYGRHLSLSQWDTRVNSNNTYVELFACTGLLGGLTFLWLAWQTIASPGRALGSSPTADLPLLAGATASVLAFLGHGFTDYFLGFTPTYVMIWLTMGLGFALVNIVRDTEGCE